jgi:hypothetical protein
MSTFELPIEHLQLLVAAAQRLGITRLPHPNAATLVLALDTFDGRQALLDLLSGANSAAAAPLPHAESRSGRGRWPDVRLSKPDEVVQVLQYVRCYEYQCSQHAGWPESNARIFCALLKESLLDRLAAMFKSSWVFEPPTTDTRIDLDEYCLGSIGSGCQ